MLLHCNIWTITPSLYPSSHCPGTDTIVSTLLFSSLHSQHGEGGVVWCYVILLTSKETSSEFSSHSSQHNGISGAGWELVAKLLVVQLMRGLVIHVAVVHLIGGEGGGWGSTTMTWDRGLDDNGVYNYLHQLREEWEIQLFHNSEKIFCWTRRGLGEFPPGRWSR